MVKRHGEDPSDQQAASAVKKQQQRRHKQSSHNHSGSHKSRMNASHNQSSSSAHQLQANDAQVQSIQRFVQQQKFKHLHQQFSDSDHAERESNLDGEKQQAVLSHFGMKKKPVKKEQGEEDEGERQRNDESNSPPMLSNINSGQQNQREQSHIVTDNEEDSVKSGEGSNESSREGSLDRDAPANITSSCIIQGTIYHMVNFNQAVQNDSDQISSGYRSNLPPMQQPFQNRAQIEEDKDQRDEKGREKIKPRLYTSQQLRKQAPDFLFDFYESQIEWQMAPK